jgi:hypothetical protein
MPSPECFWALLQSQQAGVLGWVGFSQVGISYDGHRLLVCVHTAAVIRCNDICYAALPWLDLLGGILCMKEQSAPKMPGGIRWPVATITHTVPILGLRCISTYVCWELMQLTGVPD